MSSHSRTNNYGYLASAKNPRQIPTTNFKFTLARFYWSFFADVSSVRNADGPGMNLLTRIWYSLYSGYLLSVIDSVSTVEAYPVC